MFSLSDMMQHMMAPWFEGGTYIIERASHESKKDIQAAYVDTICLSYLGELLRNTNLVPFQSEGDGNCLLHAVCKAVNGKDANFQELRGEMAKELVENELWYRFYLDFDDARWSESLDMARGDGNYLGFEHIFALSNVLRRPIILLDNLSVSAAYGEGDGGVAATFLPTRHPIPPVIAPPLMIAWASEEHRHYVPIVPALQHNDQYPRIPLPQVACLNTMPPGAQIQDYLHYRVATPSADCVVEVHLAGQTKSAISRLQAGDDILENALIITRRFCMGKEKIPLIANFLTDFAVAHAIPTNLSDYSWRTLQGLNGIGPYPSRKLRDPPPADMNRIAAIANKAIATLDPALTAEQLALFQQLLEFRATSVSPSTPTSQNSAASSAVIPLSAATAAASATNGHSPKSTTPTSKSPAPPVVPALNLPEEAVLLLLDLLPKLSQPVPLIGTLHNILSAPAASVGPLVRKLKIPQRLMEIVKSDTPQPAILLLLRCCAVLLNPEFDIASFPIVYNPYLMEHLRNVVDTLQPLHFLTLGPFLHNYATFISHTQLIAPAVRETHLRMLATFIARCFEHKDAAEVPAALESALLGVGTILLAQPALGPTALDIIGPLLPEFASLRMQPMVLTDLEKLMKRPVPTNNLSRVPNLLRE